MSEIPFNVNDEPLDLSFLDSGDTTTNTIKEEELNKELTSSVNEVIMPSTTLQHHFSPQDITTAASTPHKRLEASSYARLKQSMPSDSMDSAIVIGLGGRHFSGTHSGANLNGTRSQPSYSFDDRNRNIPHVNMRTIPVDETKKKSKKRSNSVDGSASKCSLRSVGKGKYYFLCIIIYPRQHLSD